MINAPACPATCVCMVASLAQSAAILITNKRLLYVLTNKYCVQCCAAEDTGAEAWTNRGQCIQKHSLVSAQRERVCFTSQCNAAVYQTSQGPQGGSKHTGKTVAMQFKLRLPAGYPCLCAMTVWLISKQVCEHRHQVGTWSSKECLNTFACCLLCQSGGVALLHYCCRLAGAQLWEQSLMLLPFTQDQHCIDCLPSFQGRFVSQLVCEWHW